MFWFTVTFDRRRIEADRLDEKSLNKLESLRVLIVDELEERRLALSRELSEWRVAPDHASGETEATQALARATGVSCQQITPVRAGDLET